MRKYPPAILARNAIYRRRDAFCQRRDGLVVKAARSVNIRKAAADPNIQAVYLKKAGVGG